MQAVGREVLALVADTHDYREGLPLLLAFFRRWGVRRLAVLGDCPPEPFAPWLEMGADQELYWIYDVSGEDLPTATEHGLALNLGDRIFLAHTRANAINHHKKPIHDYLHGEKGGRPPLVICHGHTHTPSLSRYGRRLNRMIYNNQAVRPYLFQKRQAYIELRPDMVYLVVPGAFILEEGRFPTFSFALLDLPQRRVEMISLKDLQDLETLELLSGRARPGPAGP